MSSASVPPRQSSMQRQARPDTIAAPLQPQSTSLSEHSSSTSSDTSTLQRHDDTSAKSSTVQEVAVTAETNQEHGAGDRSNDEKKCWICFAESSEDTAETSPWRDPCPCALVAHEACLLDWIADIEAPNRNQARSLSAPRIECPQCKSEIKLARPQSYVVDAVRNLERWSVRLVTPGALTVLFGTVYQSSVAWGIHSIYAVFGAEEGFQILEPLLLRRVRPPFDLDSIAREDIGRRLFDGVLDQMTHWRLYIGLPLITPLLILSRTHLADTLLPALPIAFFATQSNTSQGALELGVWPPTASLAFAVLPYIRTAYNAYHHIVWSRHEKRWLQEIQPRSNEGSEDADNVAGNFAEDGALAEGEDGNIFEIRVDGGMWEEWEDEDAIIEDAQAQVPEAQLPNANVGDQHNHGIQPAEGDQAAQAAAEVVDPPGQDAPAGAPRGGNQGERRLSFSPTAIAETVLGALLFPSIASVSGELLRLALPRGWTASPSTATHLGIRVPSRGILQHKWGRSLVGGCLFVVLKDTLMLYVRWKMAQMHRRRRVLDHIKSQKEGVA